MYGLAEHQRYGSSLLDCMDALGLFFGCGCGKTATVLDWVYRHVTAGDMTDVLVVCPASLCDNWTRSIDRMAEFEGYTQEGIAMVREAVTVTSYQKVYKRTVTEVRKRDGTVVKRAVYPLRPEIDRPWDAVIVDESHALGSHSSAQTKACLNLAKLCKHRVILSGTPVTGGGGRADYSKMYGQVNFLSPGFFGTWGDFIRRCVTSLDHWGNPQTYRTDVCERILNDHGIFVRIEDVFDMPDRIYTPMPVKLGKRAKKAYDDVMHGRWTDWGFDVRVAGGQYVKLYQICSGFLYRDDGEVETFETAKDDIVRQLIEDNDGKTVIFARYSHSIAKLRQILPEAVVFDGDSKGPTWQEFQDGEARVIITQYQVGNAGLDLFASHTMILYEPPLSALQLEQAQDRIYRKGQVNQCRYIYLYTEGTFEQKALESVRKGVDVTNALMDKWAGVR